jgi:ATP-dependent RNA helicase DOB1
MVDEKMEKESLQGMCMGQPQPLNSEFKLSYYSILNLLKRASGQASSEYVIARSFHQFQHTRAVPIKQARLAVIDAERSELVVAGETAVKEYAELRAGIAECEKEMLVHIVEPARALSFLKPGRMIRVRDGDTDWGWGVVVNVVNVGTDGGGGAGNVSSYVVDALLQCAPGATEGRLAPAPRAADDKKGQLAEEGCTVEVIPVALKLVAGFSAIRLTLPDDLRQRHARESVGRVDTLHIMSQSKYGSIDDSQYVPCNQSDTPRERQTKHGSIDDSQYVPCNQSDTPRERQTKRGSIDDSQYVPCNQSDTPRECQP